MDIGCKMVWIFARYVALGLAKRLISVAVGTTSESMSGLLSLQSLMDVLSAIYEVNMG